MDDDFNFNGYQNNEPAQPPQDEPAYKDVTQESGAPQRPSPEQDEPRVEAEPVHTGYEYGNPTQHFNQPQPPRQPQQNPYSYGPQGQQPGYGGFGQPQRPQPPQPPQQPKKSRGMIGFVIAVVAVLVVAAISVWFLFNKKAAPAPEGASTATTAQAEENASAAASKNNVEPLTASAGGAANGDATAVYEKVRKFNVAVMVYSNNKLYSEGSGAIVSQSKDGKYTYVVTCAHVINYSSVGIIVKLEDGTEYPADVVGYDTRTDIGVLQIEAKDLPCAEFASSASLTVGQTVYAIGNPGGSEFFGSFTKGMISAISRPIGSSSTGYEMECIQHDAAINPGNSGGALVDGNGCIVGINSQKIASTEYEGMGFAVPSDMVMEVFNSIVDNGYVVGRAKLGVRYTVPSSYSQSYAMYVQVKGLPSGSIVIAEIDPESKLNDYDVKVGDLITQVNGKDMTAPSMLADMIENMSVGDELKLTIVHINTSDWSQTEQEVTVSLIEDKGTTQAETTTQSSNPFDNYSGSDWYDFFRQFGGR